MAGYRFLPKFLGIVITKLHHGVDYVLGSMRVYKEFPLDQQPHHPTNIHEFVHFKSLKGTEDSSV